ncbi:MAG: hypothetical protein JNG88_18215 [Phycisphaerales bacterium]|nr:hypothetical protein [Phycisphaerales bacterium]
MPCHSPAHCIKAEFDTVDAGWSADGSSHIVDVNQQVTCAVNNQSPPQSHVVATRSLPDLTRCFAPATTPAVIAEFIRRTSMNEAQAAEQGGAAYDLTGRWPGVQGSPLELRWSFVPDGLIIPGGVTEPASPSNLFAVLDE